MVSKLHTLFAIVVIVEVSKHSGFGVSMIIQTSIVEISSLPTIVLMLVVVIEVQLSWLSTVKVVVINFVMQELAGVRTTSVKIVVSFVNVVVVNSHTVLTVVLVITGGMDED